MNEPFRRPSNVSYEADYALWCAEQGALLREGRLSSLDRENLAEEIDHTFMPDVPCSPDDLIRD